VGTLSELYLNVAQDTATEDAENHPSIQTVAAHITAPVPFDSSPVTLENITDTFNSKSNS